MNLAAKSVEYKQFVIEYTPGLGGFWGVPYAPATLPHVATRASKRAYNAQNQGGWANCVYVVRKAGFYVPQNPRIWAKYLPVKSTTLPPEGVKTVIKTAEGNGGHVVVAVNKGGVLTSIIDSAGAGRTIPLSVYQGQI